MSAAPSSSASSGRAGQHGETDVDPAKFIHRNPFLRTVNAIMPYKTSGQFGIDADGAAGTLALRLMIRLNSIYDVLSTTAYSANPVPNAAAVTADAADATVQKPMFRDYWMTYYHYWHVIGCKYTIKLIHAVPSLTGSLECYVYEHGKQQPPLLNIAGTAIIPYQYRRHHPNMKHHEIIPEEKTLAQDGYRHKATDYYHVYSGTYKPGSINHEVVEDELAQVWHKREEVPPNPETCSLIVQASEYNADTGTQYVNYEITIEYLVQMKDLQSGFEYLSPDSAIPADAAYAAQVN